MEASEYMRRRHNISYDQRVFATELGIFNLNFSIFTKFNPESKLSVDSSDSLLVEEVVNYTLGDLLSDIGGILGFFLGLSLLQCLKQIWRALVQSAPMTFLTRFICDSRHRSVSFRVILDLSLLFYGIRVSFKENDKT